MVNEPELRLDRVTGRQVIFAVARAAVPRTVQSTVSVHAEERARRSDQPLDCPFCPGNEHETRPEIRRSAVGVPGNVGWTTRVFPNRYPIVTDRGIGGATGRAEVVVFSPVHSRTLDELSDSDVAVVMAVFRDRMRALHDAGLSSVHVYINEGSAAGASIAHPHAQVVGTGFLPAAERTEIEMVGAAPPDPLRADLCDAGRRELVIIDGPITAWCPWAAPAPFLVRIASRTHGPDFVALDDGALTSLGQVLNRSLDAIRRCLADPPYNIVFYGDRSTDSGARRWRVEIVPRLTVGGGFEQATDTSINATDPRAAASLLRASSA